MQKIIYFKERADTKISLLSVIYITSLLANLEIGYRYISIGPFDQSGGIFIFPISFIINGIIAELYGSELAKKLVLYGIICQLIFALYAFFIIRLPAPHFLNHKETYYFVFNSYINFAIASTISIWIGSKVNIIILSKLSEFFGGKYFALRSFLASTAGEFLVTVISMFIANFHKMSINNLIYMIICCFFVKTIISFFAIWPAALVVHKIENPREFHDSFSFEKLLKPISFIKNIFYVAWNVKGCSYNLESINIESKKVNLYFKGAKGEVSFLLKNLVFNFSIINRMKANDASHIGYYYAILEEGGSQSIFIENRPDLYNLNQGILNIKAISRDGKLIIEDKFNSVIFKKFPIDIYRNNLIIDNFSTRQALYIGYLSGLSELVERDSKPVKNRHLRLVK